MMTRSPASPLLSLLSLLAPMCLLRIVPVLPLLTLVSSLPLMSSVPLLAVVLRCSVMVYRPTIGLARLMMGRCAAGIIKSLGPFANDTATDESFHRA